MRWCTSFILAFILAQVAASDENAPYNATVSASILGPSTTARALQHLVALVLTEAGVPTVPQPEEECFPKDAQTCVHESLKALGQGAVAALITRNASSFAVSPTAWQLREYGIEELGDLAPPSRRACLTTETRPIARSLLDLQDAKVAAAYHVSDEVIDHALSKHSSSCYLAGCPNSTIVPKWCIEDHKCATLLTSSESEARVLESVIRLKYLFATVRPIGDLLPNIAQDLASPVIVCDWAPELTGLANLTTRILGPPPCVPFKPCPFETRRLIKYANKRLLAHSPNAIQTLERLQLEPDDVREISELAEAKGPEMAAKEFLAKHPTVSQGLREVRVAVMLSYKTERETFDGRALAASAALVERDLSENRPSTLPRFKVEIYDDRCNTARAYKYLSNAWASEYEALTAIAGPGCGTAWAAVAPQTPAHRLPLLAYTPQALAVVDGNKAGSVTALQLLAAGDSSESGNALSEFLLQMGWHRLAVLSEAATRSIADPARLHATLEVHLELPDGDDVDRKSIEEWANRSAAVNLRILYVCLEDARAIRQALCSGKAAGLMPNAGIVWILCRTPERDWMQTNEQDNCTREELEEVSSGFITITTEWTNRWQIEAANASAARKEWERRWQKQCLETFSDGKCQSPGSAAAMLYDILKLWAQALDALLIAKPKAVYGLHDPDHIRTLIANATTANFKGLTGDFVWKEHADSFIRKGELVVSQWLPIAGLRTIGKYVGGVLEIEAGELKWQTSNGRAPDDGGEKCAVAGLARGLGVECRAAWAMLGAVMAVLLLGALAALAVYCRRKAEREYRKRLAALGMRPLATKPVGFDKWEVPRERVVINRKLGTGAFGTVYGGHALLSPDHWTAVAVKTLKAGASTDEKLDFLSEAEAMKRFDHKNVVRLLGVVTKTEPVCTVMEFMLYGDLKGYLLARRGLAAGEAGAEGAEEVSPRRLTSMALDVARALSYLAQLRYVHRDVAARNCLVSARRVVKLADFGMTRLVFENDYYRFSRKGMLPVRWMAPESLALGVFSPASDVWSFGVLLYEIVTFGSLPFQGYSNSEVLTRVKGGHTLDLPPGLKPQLEGLIKSCWQQDSKYRPTASEIAVFLADAPRLLAPCLDIPLDALPLDADPPWRLPRDQAEARWISWAAPASAATDTTYLSADGPEHTALDTDSFLP